MPRKTGTVRKFDDGKGYGFITIDGGTKGEDAFVHFSAIRAAGKGRRRLKEGERVEFDLVNTEKGLAAKDVVSESVYL